MKEERKADRQAGREEGRKARRKERRKGHPNVQRNTHMKDERTKERGHSKEGKRGKKGKRRKAKGGSNDGQIERPEGRDSKREANVKDEMSGRKLRKKRRKERRHAVKEGKGRAARKEGREDG